MPNFHGVSVSQFLALCQHVPNVLELMVGTTVYKVNDRVMIPPYELGYTEGIFTIYTIRLLTIGTYTMPFAELIAEGEEKVTWVCPLTALRHCN